MSFFYDPKSVRKTSNLQCQFPQDSCNGARDELEKYKRAYEALDEKMDEFGGYLISIKCPPQVLHEFRGLRREAVKENPLKEDEVLG